ncbi:retinol dehydrogenase 13-like [Ostrea edulis]|uniref:retinol dehydrogenase 13-like n=1 Tax=Ostrea edulis TaxID=37623 RepID=UPI0024AFB726|nr:retinol dehydrogenase 13-like [Ostrea edulis]XP_048735007.2 retinol dehydrogenase 13-like [Ostrea edulis]
MSFPNWVYHASALGTIGLGSLLLRDYLSGKVFQGEELLMGKTAIVTGANSGIGKETAKDFAKRGAKVIMACRDLEKCATAQEDIIQETHNQRVVCKRLDLASLKSIQEFADSVKKEEKFLDILVNNAGVMHCPYQKTEDGFEYHLGVNYLGPVYLTMSLLDLMIKSAPSRIINVSSVVHQAGHINFKDFNSDEGYHLTLAYNQSKLAILMFTKELAKQLQGTKLTVNALHPGICDTEIGRHLKWNNTASEVLSFPLRSIFLRNSYRGAQTSIFLAVSPEVEKVSGKYFSDCKEKKVTSEQFLNDEDCKRLWLMTLKMIKLI